MKFLKKTILLIILIVSFCLINANVKAYDIFEFNGITYTEKELLDDFSQMSGFDKSIHTKFYCYYSYGVAYCYAFTDEQLSNEYLTTSGKNIKITLPTENCKYYSLSYSKTGNKNSSIRECFNPIGFYSTDPRYTNFDVYLYSDEENEQINVLNFNFDEEEPKELEITISGTEILTSILDKTKNIYEVLISNQLFVLCSCILLSYLVFIILYKTIRK